MLKIKSIGRKASYGLVLVLLTSILSACNTAGTSSRDRVSSTDSTSNQSDYRHEKKSSEFLGLSAAAYKVRGAGSISSSIEGYDSRIGFRGADYQSPGLRAVFETQQPDTAQYKNYSDNPVKQVVTEPVSTFSLDMDTASYANSRRFIAHGRMPHPDAVRVEEFINYFPSASNEKLTSITGSPFSAGYELAPSPWNTDKVLLRVNIKANDVNFNQLPPSNLVFLIDTSGSMDGEDRLDLLKQSLKLLVNELRPQDKVSIVTYAGSAGVALESTSGSNKAKIMAAINKLEARGSTAGGEGLQLAYKMAERGKVKGGINRILLATDGDFNVGINSTEELKAFVSREKEKGITLSTLGFGTNNFNDAMMVQIADAGNGNYSYIDSLEEAQKVLQEEMSATLVTVAKDVKAQIEFNPAQVLEYRQIGYEKRQLKQEDFNNDKVDAGDIGAGKKLTVLYELTLAGGKPSIDPLRYQSKKSATATNANNNEIAFLKLRWKAPRGQKSELASLPIEKKALASSFAKAGVETRFMAAVAAYGQKLRNNPELSKTSYQQIASWANNAKGEDKQGYRAEFVKLVRKAAALEDKNN
ncbi:MULTISPECIES: VWA domain-containing protein [unclassified Snodgrassella]|uniref:vWA domain-containing protein n=1 Tax=unclassified Snodgrassella TaxID=2625236 RepID=UPI0018DC30B1|nr:MULTISPECIES: VWA domain-containing protein [unclassified Snodgrassella]MBI0130514.1 VWA domain-containing protein [Snodgrassella sp. W8124]MBI0159490.1 VWA domain-containing protein [Snodgrassella sp. W6238H11]MBI0161675.1 VWA domain-containing protein [Snodgrassella sp. W6238H14]